MYVHYIALNSVHDNDYIEEKPNGLADLLFLHIKTPCTIIIDSQIHTILSPSVILINSNTPYKYFPTGSEYIDDYLHFKPDDMKTFISKLTFPLNEPIKIPNNMFISEVLHLIEQEHILEKQSYSKSISTLIDYLMLKIQDQYLLSNTTNKDIPHFAELSSVHEQILSSYHKNWTIEELSHLAHLSPAYFQVLYKKAFGVTCFTDIIHVKISQAKLLLSSTDYMIREISQELGYNEVYHFIRQFKKLTGMTPREFRKKSLPSK